MSKKDIKKEERLDPKERRRLAWESKQKENSTDGQYDREQFRKFFIKIKGKLKLDNTMEDVIWKHFKAAGFDKEEKFQDGISHFGYKL